MNAAISLDFNVQQTLDACPSAIQVFIQMKTHCVGCWMARFCTLQEVAARYHFNAQEFLENIQQHIQAYPEEEGS
jgi:hybrid cluster-associated redox disulfide protein